MTKHSQDAAQRRVGSVRNAAAILRYLQEIGAGIGVNAIARTLRISPSSCFNLLKTLVDETLVDFDNETKRYSLGTGAIILGRRALDPYGAFELVRQRLESMADKHQVTVGLWRPRRGDQLVLVGYADSAAAFRIHLTVGQRLPIASGAAGRCVMAISPLDSGAIRRWLDKVKWAEAPNPKKYLAELDAVRQRGYAIDEGQFIKGVSTLAAPGVTPVGAIEYIVTATMFTGQYPHERMLLIAEDLRATAKWLVERLFDNTNTIRKPIVQTEQTSRSMSRKKS
ncbi:MAG: IclR family transcriptional regulator [Gammaproteobacteria bacterium]|nr:IclR family transcriptional regulator [Gammaproteobacteria bacterium]